VPGFVEIDSQLAAAEPARRSPRPGQPVTRDDPADAMPGDLIDLLR
jgi:hypothetical protein